MFQGSFAHIDVNTEDRREFVGFERPPPPGLAYSQRLIDGGLHHLGWIYAAQGKQQLWFVVEARAHRVKRRRHMLAHGRPVGARAPQRDLTRRWKQPLVLAGHDLHHTFGNGAPQQFDQRVDPARALALDTRPPFFRQGLDLDVHLVDFRAADERAHATDLDL